MSAQNKINDEIIKFNSNVANLAIELLKKLLKKKDPIAEISRKIPQKSKSLESANRALSESPKSNSEKNQQEIKEQFQTSETSEELTETKTQKTQPKEELLCGVREGKGYLKLTAEDALAISTMMVSEIGTTVPNAENLIVRSPDGKTLFEADESGRVIKSIYQENAKLLFDRDFQRSSGLENFKSILEYVKNSQSQQTARVSRQSNSIQQQVDRTLDEIKKKVPAVPLDSAMGKQINQNRGSSYSNNLSKEAALIAVFHNEVLKISPLDPNGRNQSINLEENTTLVKSNLANGDFRILVRGEKDPKLELHKHQEIASFSAGTGWTISPAFSELKIQEILSKEIEGRELMSLVDEYQLPGIESASINNDNKELLADIESNAPVLYQTELAQSNSELSLKSSSSEIIIPDVEVIPDFDEEFDLAY